MIGDIYAYFSKRLSDNFPGVSVQTGYPREKVIAPPPCIYVDMYDIAPGDNVGSGELELTTRWQIRHVVALSQPNAHVAARSVALKIAAIFDQSCPLKNAYDLIYLGASDDNFDVDEPGYESWVSEFSLKIRIKDNDWDNFDMYDFDLSRYAQGGGGDIRG